MLKEWTAGGPPGTLGRVSLMLLSSVLQSHTVSLSHFAFQLLNHVQLFAVPQTAARQASLLFTILWNLLRLMTIELVMPSKHLILCCLLLLLLSVFPSIRISSSESGFHIRWPKYWSFSISPSNEYISLLSKGLLVFS